MNIELLQYAGLTPAQSETLSFLLQKGVCKAITVSKAINRPRAAVYRLLDDLLAMQLIEKIERPGTIALFRAVHPAKLEERFEEQEKIAKRKRKQFADALPDFISTYNLASHKPGVKFLEGEAGLWKILDDTLTTKDTIYTFADAEAVHRYMEDINREYVKKRDKLGIKKKLVFVDSPFARDYLKNYFTNITDARFVEYQLHPFSSLMQIYDGKVAYISLSEHGIISLLITDPNIYQMNKSLFEFVWAHAKKIELNK
jgi:sugar-specific transcriptional regulator TrmB